MGRIFIKLINNLRLINSRTYVRRTRLTPNPGVERQLKIYSDKNSDNPNLYEGYEDMESDFMNVQQQHKYWEKEAALHKERISNAIVKNKYFKQKTPNFLTWSEKEQIRQLYTEDPEEWNFEKLADSFPADVETIAKVVKSKWAPNDERRIEKHDSVVKHNWDLFKQKQIENVNPRLAFHLSRFINREHFQGTNLQSIKLAKQQDLLKLHEPKSKEFSSIITKFSASKIKEIEEPLNNGPRLESTNDLVIRNNKPITLSRLKQQSSHEKNDAIDSNIDPDKTISIQLDHHIDLMKDNNIKTNTAMTAEVERAEMIVEHIKIPKKLWKQGATYKIKDCFYDCDGEFLYRVPGMSGT